MANESSEEWRARMMQETEGMTKPGEILAHLAEDARVNGPPPGAATAMDRIMRPGVTIETIGPCPFCGSNRAALCEIGPRETGPRVWVECPACDATGPVCGGHEEDGDRSDVAIDLWNNADCTDLRARDMTWIRDNAIAQWEQWKEDGCPGAWTDFLADALAATQQGAPDEL